VVAPQVVPPPNAVNTMRCPGWNLSAAAASASARGIDAADVLPTRSRLMTARSALNPSWPPMAAAMMRALA